MTSGKLKLSGILSFFDHLDPGSLAYGILKPCRRCVYSKHYDPALVVTRDRGPRVIVNLDGNCYSRQGDCIGYSKCGKCFSAVKDNTGLPCTWNRF